MDIRFNPVYSNFFYLRLLRKITKHEAKNVKDPILNDTSIENG